MFNSRYDHIFKLLLIGDTNIGKSSLLLRYTDNVFTNNFMSTIGIDFRVKVLNYDNKKIKLQIWDTTGQERFINITNAYYRNAMLVLLVYDVTNMKSFENIKIWMHYVKEHASKDVIVMLVGNKSDKENRVVTYEMGKLLADELNIKFIETSAKENLNVNETFTMIVQQLEEKYSSLNDVNTQINSNIDLLNNDSNKSKSCCF